MRNTRESKTFSILPEEAFSLFIKRRVRRKDLALTDDCVGCFADLFADGFVEGVNLLIG